MLPHIAPLLLISFLATRATYAAAEVVRYNTVNLRIETNLTTLYEGPIYSGPRNITIDNATALCNGQGAGYSNPGSPPSNTPTDALDAAAQARGFAYYGYYDSVYNDFLMRMIAGLENWGDGKTYLFRGSMVNYQGEFSWGRASHEWLFAAWRIQAMMYYGRTRPWDRASMIFASDFSIERNLYYGGRYQKSWTPRLLRQDLG